MSNRRLRLPLVGFYEDLHQRIRGDLRRVRIVDAIIEFPPFHGGSPPLNAESLYVHGRAPYEQSLRVDTKALV